MIMRENLKKIISDAKKSSSTVEEIIKILDGSMAGLKTLIISGGPSLNNISGEMIEALPEDVIVIAVKQSFYKAPKRIDIHLINEDNYQVYDYASLDVSPFVIKVSSSSLVRCTPKSDEHLEFKISKESSKNFSQTLTNTCEFENWQLTNRVDRPWGPGIMYEIGIYLPLLLGCKEIYVAGWDLGDPKSNVINRFYENDNWLKIFRNIVIGFSPNFYNKFFNRVENFIRLGFFQFNNKVLLNIPGVTVNEAVLIAHSSKNLYKWLISKNISLFVISDVSMLSDLFERKDFFDVF